MKHVQERFLLIEAILVQLLICIGLFVVLPMLTFRLRVEHFTIFDSSNLHNLEVNAKNWLILELLVFKRVF